MHGYGSTTTLPAPTGGPEPRESSRGGFTLIELTVSLTIFAISPMPK